jgi:hypothetical protein
MASARFFRLMSVSRWPAWLVFGMILSGVWYARAQDATENGGASQGPVVVNQRAIRHIEERHWPDSPAQGAGKFSPGITEDLLRQLIAEAVNNGRVRRNSHGRSGEIYEYDFGHPIGITIDGRAAYRLRVVVNQRNQVITAFPF